jgi:hypothetical protein
MRFLLPAMSKMPPENLQAVLQLGDALADRGQLHHGARQSSTVNVDVYVDANESRR